MIKILWNSIFHRKETREYNKCKNDPIYFIETYVKINKNTPFNLYDKQKRIIESLISNNNDVLFTHMNRQEDATSSIIAYIIWKSMFYHDQNIGIMGAQKLVF